MKTTTIPPLRVPPALRREAEALLADGETLSAFMLEALQKNITQRRDQKAFMARGLASSAKARRTGRYVSAETVQQDLSTRLASSKSKAIP
jgi:predicted transcriptional regulator